MSDRSDEVTASRESNADSGSEPRSTDDLLEETERLLGGSERGAGGGSGSTGTAASTGNGTATGRGTGTETDARTEPETGADSDPDSSGRSWLPSLLSRDSSSAGSNARSRTGSVRSRFSISYYFSPKAFLAFVLTIGAALFAGGFAVPIAGRLLGTVAVTFLIGLATSRRRYAEMTAAGVAVGGVSTLADHAILAFAGALQGSTAVGITAGLLACLAGYYFGRDLRAGLFRDVD